MNFYGTLAECVHGPLLLYNFPDRTGHDLTPDMIYKLVSEHENIVGIKDTVSTMGHTKSYYSESENRISRFYGVFWI